MIIALTLLGVLLIMVGAMAAAWEQLVLGLITFALGVASVGYGLIQIERQQDRDRAACVAEGGTFKEFRGDDVCFAPGTVLR